LAVDGAVWVVGAVALALVGLFAVRRFVPHHVLAAHNDVAGFVYATIAVTYAVILGFVVVSVWEKFEDATTNAEREANEVADLYRLAAWFPDSDREALQNALADYARSVVADEWPAMHRGDAPAAETGVTLQAVWDLYRAIDQTSDVQTVAYDDSLDRLQDLGNDRRLRILQSDGGLPGILWAVLVAGGALTIGFAFGFGVERTVSHALMISILAASVGLLLFLVWSLNHPFQGGVAVSPDGYELAIRQFAGS
jgi:hypothetical protein